MKRLAIGIDDFRKIIKEDCYYVDKTKFIADVLQDASNVKLFTRPRRFGKTLNMSMLKYFFDVRESEENRKLFNGLDIEKSKYIDEQGKYPTILISLKSIKYETWEESLEQLKSLISNLYNEFEYIRESLNENEIEHFNDFEKYFQEIILKLTSNWDISKEAFYHGLSLGMLSYLDNDYYVTSNFEAGFGRYDVVLEPKNKNNRAFILEFKVTDDENKLEKLSKEKIKQIEEKRYDINLNSRGIKEVTFVGVAFYGKKLKVSYK